MLNRTECVICEKGILEELDAFKNVPVFMGVRSPHDHEEYTEDQVWNICSICGCVQLKYLIEPSLLYSRNHNPGTIGKSWQEHHSSFSKFITTRLNRFEGKKKNVAEVGAGNAILAKQILESVRNPIYYTIIDPNTHSNNPDIRVIGRLLQDVNVRDRFDVIIHSHTMEHFYTPLDDLRRMYDLLNPNGEMFVSVPIIKEFLKSGYTNGLNFEHTYLTTMSNLLYLFSRSGFRLLETFEYSPHNVFFHLTKDSTVKKNPVSISSEYFNNKKLFQTYVSQLLFDISSLNTKISNTTDAIFLYGAHIFSQMLISQGLDISRISAVLDNDPTKQNNKLYGSSLTVHSPSILATLYKPTVIVRTAQYTHEICDNLRSICPEVEII